MTPQWGYYGRPAVEFNTIIRHWRRTRSVSPVVLAVPT